MSRGSARPRTPSCNQESPEPKTAFSIIHESARPKTPSVICESGRPKTASALHESARPKTAPSTREKTQPLVSFEEFNKQFCNLKVQFDSHGYVIPQKYFPPEMDMAVQGKQIPLSESK